MRLIILLAILLLPFTIHAQQTIVVPPGGNLQAAINSAQLGDTIILARDVRYLAPTTDAFNWPVKSGCNGTSYVTITTEGWNHVGRVVDGSGMAKIVARHGRGAIQVLANAGCLRLKGIEVTNQSSGTEQEHVQDLIGSADGGYRRNSKPAYFIFDQVYVHPQEDNLSPSDPNYHLRTASHGISLSVANLTIINSRLTGFQGVYRHGPSIVIDGEAIVYAAGPGPFRVHNNLISAQYAGILTGGADSDSDNFGTISSASSSSSFSISLSGGSLPLVGDMIAVGNPGKEYSACKVTAVSGNAVTCDGLTWNGQQNTGGADAMVPAPVPAVGQPVKWRGFVMNGITVTQNSFRVDPIGAQYVRNLNGSNPKGYIEFKNGDNGLLDGNDFDGWPTSVGFGLQNQAGGAPWSSIRHWTLSNNLFRRYSYMFGPMSITGYSRRTERGGDIRIINNLGYGPGGQSDVNGNAGAFFTVGAMDGPLVVSHNTGIDRPDGFTVQFNRDRTMTGTATYTDNILYGKDYGHQCNPSDGHAMQCYQNMVSNKNIIVNPKNISPSDIQSYWWPNSIVVANTGAVGFVDPSANDYRLLSTSVGFRAGTDGKDTGVDVDQLLAHLGGSAAPQPTPSVSPTPQPTPSVPLPSPSPSPSVPLPTPTPMPSPQISPTPVPTPPPAGQFVLSGKTFLATDGSTFTFTRVVLTDSMGNHRDYDVNDGTYRFTVTPGSYTLEVVQDGWNSSPARIHVVNATAATGGLSIMNFTLGPSDWFKVGPDMCVPLNAPCPPSQPSPTPTVTPTPQPTPTVTPTPIPIPTATPTPLPSPSPSPTVMPSPSPTPIPQPPSCTVSVPDTVTMSRNSTASVVITVTVGSTPLPVVVTAIAGTGQVVVTPTRRTATTASVSLPFVLRTKQNPSSVRWESVCGIKTTQVLIR